MNQFLKCINLILTLYYITGYSFLLFCHIYTWTVSVCVFQILIYSPWMKDIVSVLQTFEYVVLHAFLFLYLAERLPTRTETVKA